MQINTEYGNVVLNSKQQEARGLMWSPLKGSFLGDFVYCFAYLITLENHAQPHNNFSLCGFP